MSFAFTERDKEEKILEPIGLHFRLLPKGDVYQKKNGKDLWIMLFNSMIVVTELLANDLAHYDPSIGTDIRQGKKMRLTDSACSFQMTKESIWRHEKTRFHAYG